MDRILRNTTSRIKLEIRDNAYALRDADGSVTVAIVDGAGAAAGGGAATRDGTGEYSFPVTLALLDVYTATWTATVDGTAMSFQTTFEVAGGFIFSVTEARAYDRGLGDSDEITAQAIVDTREIVEERFERECAACFVPRGARTVVDGDPWNPSRIVLRRPDTAAPVSRISRLNSIVVDGVALAPEVMADMHIYADEGAIQSLSQSFFGVGYRNIQVWYEHGYDQVPAPVKRAALEYARMLLLEDNEDQRSLNSAAEMDPRGMTNFTGPSRFRPTGIPQIDAVLWRYSDRMPGFA